MKLPLYLILSGASGHNKPPLVLRQVWGLWAQQTSFSDPDWGRCTQWTSLGAWSYWRPLDKKNSLTTGSCLGPFDATNLASALAPVWDFWIQRSSLSCWSCLGTWTQQTYPSPCSWDLWTQTIQTQKTLQRIRTRLRQFHHQTFRCNILTVLQEWRSKPTMLTAKLNF